MTNTVINQYNDSKLSSADIADIIRQVRTMGRVSLLDISLIHGTTNGLYDSGLLKEENGFVVLVEEKAEAPVEEAIEAKLTVDEQVQQLLDSPDAAFRQAGAMYQECLGDDWFSELIRQDEAELEQRQKEEQEHLEMLAREGQILLIENLKLKNLNRNDSYWLFVGNYDDCHAGQVALWEHLVRSTLKENGKSGECFKLIVDRIHKGYIEVGNIADIGKVA